VSERWLSVRLDEVEPIPVAGGLLWRPLRRTLGVEAFGINAYVARNAGDDVVEKHSESRLQHEEVYVVISGRATFTLADESFAAPAGTVVFIRDPAVQRHARAEEPGTAVLAVGGKLGEAYAPSAWEVYFYAERHRAAERWELAIVELEQGLVDHPDHPGILYSLACYKALDGRRGAALAHLQRAIEIDPIFAGYAEGDTDLDSIRDMPGFPKGSDRRV
jgi:mannose-6-phosphate isomerase-like protein (cupin superfamily)